MSSNRILVLEDEALVASDIKDRLTRKGYHVLGVADTGEQAVASARELKPDVVLSDIRLTGEMDGIEAADCIRRELDTPVVFLTGAEVSGNAAKLGRSHHNSHASSATSSRWRLARLQLNLFFR